MSRVLALQSGVVSRRQARDAGLDDHDVRRLLRRREWVTHHPGVYLDHTGPPSWLQRAWAGVLCAGPGAALWGPTALRAADGPGRAGVEERVLHVAVEHGRSRLTAPDAVRVHQVRGLAEKVQWNVGPPRMRYEEAALDVALGASSQLEVVAALARACHGRRTTADRMLASLDGRSRARSRSWVRDVLQDVADGTASVLEHGYVTLVERAHGLPRAARQVRARTSAGVIYRDAQYAEQCRVELDGRLFHDTTAQRDADHERDLDAAVEGARTVRLTYGQVFGRPCSTAAKVAAVLRGHGVAADPHPCGRACPVGAGTEAVAVTR